MWRGIGMVVGVGGGRSDVMVVVVVLHLLCICAFDMGAFPFLLCVSLHITTIPHGSGRQADRKAARARMESWKLAGFLHSTGARRGVGEKGRRSKGTSWVPVPSDPVWEF